MKHTYSVHYEKIAVWIDPEQVFTALFGQNKYSFWLDSSKVEEGLSRFSYMGQAADILSYSLTSSTPDIFSELHKKLQIIKTPKTNLPFDFIGGYIGYFGYELKALCGGNNTHTSPYPDSLWFFINHSVVFDHKEKTIYLVSLSKQESTAKKWFKKIKNHLQILRTTKWPSFNEGFRTQSESFHFSRDKDIYLKNIQHCKERIKKGETYQVCLTNTITSQTDNNPLDVYKTLRQTNPAPYAAFLRHDDISILCSSPERFLKIDQTGHAESKPIKGTRKRSTDRAEDAKLAKDLRNSEKDRAENLMIVDLVRNDLGKVCEFGTVSVRKLMQIESYSTVHQLVSTVQGKLGKNISAIDAIKACFPGGSMTGAPKIKTMQILDQLEGKYRGVYSGALGFLSANGSVDLNIVIRTIIMHKNTLSFGAGGAILIDSDPQKEYEEMLLKTKALIEAILNTTTSANFSS